jgi:hypothetical protein
MAKMGRPKIVIDWEQFDKLCALQCPLREIACWFNCSEDTIENACKREKNMTFSDYFDIKRGNGKISIRRKQYEMAMGGSVPLLIWLGKQYLGQSDKMEQKVESNEQSQVTIIADDELKARLAKIRSDL